MQKMQNLHLAFGLMVITKEPWNTKFYIEIDLNYNYKFCMKYCLHGNCAKL